jgi:NADPH-dependent glutamate synthase beta subunit-like oxidoreductase
MSTPAHLVAIFGGAVSGAEAAAQFTQRGIPCVVFDQNALPYGKIEDGLPKWHVKLRDKEEERINEKLSSPLVHYVPNVCLGRDVDFEEVAKHWGFSAVLLATGAWKDRPLGVDGVEDYVGKGMIYQNPFIYWFNHKHEPGYSGEQYEIKDDAIVIGGGLASLDVVKVLMMELVEKAMKARGHEVNLFTLDRSLAKVLEEKGLTLDDLGVKGCTLYYRRRIKDMPLTPMATDTPEQLAKAESVREKVLNNYASKYLFRVEPLHVPVNKIVEDGKLVGLIMQETMIENGKAVPVPGSEKEVRGPYVISSIGSIPELIPGIPEKWGMYNIADEGVCRVQGYENVFAVGNAVTGRGNINESLKHGKEVSERILAEFIEDPVAVRTEEAIAAKEASMENTVDGLMPLVRRIDATQYGALITRVEALQKKQGYSGDFRAWVAKHLPQRLESLIGHE